MTSLRAGTPVIIGELQLIPIERTHLGASLSPGGLAAFGTKEPVAVAIRTQAGTRVYELQDGDESPSDYSALLSVQESQSGD